MKAVEKYKYIDILRGIAISAVIAVHSYQNVESVQWFVAWAMNYGQLGVQLFFVASAVTLCLSMSSRGNISGADFFTRRYFRIAPLYYFGIIFYFLFRVLLGWLNSGNFEVPVQYSASAVISNIFFFHGFHPGAYNHIVPGGWSIATEFLFYAFFPFLWRILSSKGDRYFYRFAVIVTLAILAVQFLFFWWIQPSIIEIGLMGRAVQNEQFGFVYASIINQAPVFLSGMAAFAVIKSGKAKVGPCLYVLAACLIIFSIVLQNAPGLRFGINGYIYPLLSGIAFSIIAIGMSCREDYNHHIWTFLAYVGKLSFSVYVIQSFVLGSLKITLRRYDLYMMLPGYIQLMILLVAGFSISIVLANITYRYIEIPGMNLGKKLIDSRRRSTIQVSESR